MKRRKGAQEEKKRSAMEWLMTFSDVLTLLITFFVLLISMSSMDSKKLLDTTSFFRGALANLMSGKGSRNDDVVSAKRREALPHPRMVPAESTRIPAAGMAKAPERRLRMLMRRADALVESARAGTEVRGVAPLDPHMVQLYAGASPVTLIKGDNRNELGLHIALLFEYGGTTANPRFRSIVEDLRQSLGDSIERVELPVAERGDDKRFLSRWQLAAWRAAFLAKALQRSAKRAIGSAVRDAGKRSYVRIIWSSGSDKVGVLQERSDG